MNKRITGWIGVDLDGTLAQYGGWISPRHIGEPIRPMVDRVREWLGQGIDVRIFTARAYEPETGTIEAIQDWAEAYIGHRLAVTCVKDYGMIQLWDDRAVRVVENVGAACCDHHERPKL